MSLPFGLYNATFVMPERVEDWYGQVWARCTKRLRYRGSRRRRAALERLRLHWFEADVQAAIAEATSNPAPRRRSR